MDEVIIFGFFLMYITQSRHQRCNKKLTSFRPSSEIKYFITLLQLLHSGLFFQEYSQKHCFKFFSNCESGAHKERKVVSFSFYTNNKSNIFFLSKLKHGFYYNPAAKQQVRKYSGKYFSHSIKFYLVLQCHRVLGP